MKKSRVAGWGVGGAGGWGGGRQGGDKTGLMAREEREGVTGTAIRAGRWWNTPIKGRVGERGAR